jgi:ribonuclease T2
MRLLSILLLAGSLAAQSFDYYVLSLSWSPLYCSDPQRADRDRIQCDEGRRYAFVTHGLWPNNTRPPHPRNCGGNARPVPRSLVDQMLGIMPSPNLIQYQWRSHGTCSGLSVDDYFANIRAAYKLVRIPQRYTSPSEDLVISADTLRREFRQANPQIPADAMMFDCAGRNLREVRVCLTRGLHPRPCTPAVRDTCGNRAVTLLRVR